MGTLKKLRSTAIIHIIESGFIICMGPQGNIQN